RQDSDRAHSSGPSAPTCRPRGPARKPSGPGYPSWFAMVRLLAGGAVDLGAPAVGPVGPLGAAAQHAAGGAPHLGLCELEGRRRLLGEVLAGTLRVARGPPPRRGGRRRPRRRPPDRPPPRRPPGARGDGARRAARAPPGPCAPGGPGPPHG